MVEERGGKRRAPRYAGALSSYIRSIQRFDLLTRSGEHRLAVRGLEGESQARTALVESNLRLVVKLATEYHRSGLSVDDLIEEGNLGLLEAARRFDPERGVRFASYATWWIHKFLIAAVNRHRVQTSVAAPSAREPQPASPNGSTRAAPPPPPDPKHAPRSRVLSFEEFMQNSGDRHFLESLADRDSQSPETVAVARELASALIAILDRMPRIEREILAGRYGLHGGAPRTLQNLADSMGYTRERVRQIEIRALARARRLLEGWIPPRQP